MDRISVADALEHAYFVGPYMSRRDGSAHATRRCVNAACTACACWLFVDGVPPFAYHSGYCFKTGLGS